MKNFNQAKVIPICAAILYALIFSNFTSHMQWYEIPNAWLWLAVVPFGLGMWIKIS